MLSSAVKGTHSRKTEKNPLVDITELTDGTKAALVE
jgi:hypothetical protein